MRSLEVLFEVPGLPAFDLPEELASIYGGAFGLGAPLVYANFVSSLDGVVALPSRPHSSALISGRNRADRFVMGLLRSCAGAVLVGAGTLRAAPGALWTPEFICPESAPAYRELRRRLGLADRPQLVIVSATGELDPAHPAMEAGAIVMTTRTGMARLRGKLPSASCVLALGDGDQLDFGAILDGVRAEGHRLILSEGGPTVIGQLLGAELLDELFLTLAPTVAGRGPGMYRPGLVEHLAFAPEGLVRAGLVSARRDGSHLFLRYALQSKSEEDPR